MDEILTEFLSETRDSVSEIDATLLQLERAPEDKTAISLIFRGLHTIKGTCGFLGLSRLGKVAHAAESVLDLMRSGRLIAGSETIDLILMAVDRIKDIVIHLSDSGQEPEGNDAGLITALLALTVPPESVANSTSESSADADTEASPMAEHFSPAATSIQSAADSIVAVKPPDEKFSQMMSSDAEPVRADQTIRVGVTLLENLMTMVSELVLTRNQVVRLANAGDDHPLSAPLQRLSNLTSELQDSVMKTRMQPVGNAWNKLPRLVRDLCRDLGKQVELLMLGQDTELDRQVLESIRDPLTHMVRNSMDHGLETPSERKAAGKRDCGKLQLTAAHEGGHIVIRLQDDGRGLNTERIRAKALSAGLATEMQLAAMTDAQIHNFIFAPGFSTAAEVTSVSGRGVGMDVVKTNIAKIGGAIDLESVSGRGTLFTIRIPLTLAVAAALIVEVADHKFAMPQIAIVELVQGRNNTNSGDTGFPIEMIDQSRFLRLRDTLLPLVDLGALLGLQPAQKEGADVHIIVVAHGASQFGLCVDRIMDTEEIVVKPVTSRLRHLKMFGGNTILGDGSVVMILDPDGIAMAADVHATEKQTVMGKVIAKEQQVQPLLLFRAANTPKAIPLGLVARIETIHRAKIETVGDHQVTQYRDSLMRLLPFPGVSEATEQTVLVFVDRSRSMGLIVDEILDVVEENIQMHPSGAVGVLGNAVIAGKATEVVDAHYWLTRAHQDWFSQANGSGKHKRSLLLVEDSPFFRQMLVPRLTAAGYSVTTAENGREAIALYASGLQIDAIVSDIEMPEMGGLELVRALRNEATESGRWSALPVIALTGQDVSAFDVTGREAGFNECVAKDDLDNLLRALQNCLPNGAALQKDADSWAA